jgi:hypothetical protein
VSNRFTEIARRKRTLVDQCARDREELVASFSQVRSSLSFGAALTALGKTLKLYPILVTGISGLLASGYASRLLRSSGKLYRMGQAILPLWYWWTKRSKSK